jgi:hypothetical protein
LTSLEEYENAIHHLQSNLSVDLDSIIAEQFKYHGSSKEIKDKQ